MSITSRLYKKNPVLCSTKIKKRLRQVFLQAVTENSLPRDTVESPLEVFKTRLDRHLSGMVQEEQTPFVQGFQLDDPQDPSNPNSKNIKAFT